MNLKTELILPSQTSGNYIILTYAKDKSDLNGDPLEPFEKLDR